MNTEQHVELGMQHIPARFVNVWVERIGYIEVECVNDLVDTPFWLRGCVVEVTFLE
ncbi:MAG: hypothetical protein NZ519_07675 [Bacteroidia bacterium]|nr:hypothetical protein [Bacteroidia bacterium]